MRSIFLSCLCLSFAIGRRAQDNPRLLLSHSLLVTYHAQRPHFYRPHGRGEPNLLAHGTQRMQSGFVPSMTAFSVPQHKLMCTIAFGGSVRIARVSACLRKGRASLFKRELDQASVAVSATCLSTSVPHSSGTGRISLCQELRVGQGQNVCQLSCGQSCCPACPPSLCGK